MYLKFTRNGRTRFRDRLLQPGILTIMKLTTCILLAACLQVSARGYSQSITLSEKNVPLLKVIKALQRQTGYDFLYTYELLQKGGNVSVELHRVSLKEALDASFKGKPITYQILNRTVVIKPAADGGSTLPPDTTFTIRGRVVDDRGAPLPGVTVSVKDTTLGTQSDAEGNYRLTLLRGSHTLVFSFIGMVTKAVEIADGRETLNIAMARKVKALQDLVITGVVERKKESFTGAVSSFTGDELKTIGNQNILQSLKTLDPSFVIIDNNSMGSDPNTLPDVEVRGKTSISSNTLRGEFGADPNQPLFILDGFETNLQTIVDLDMNRVASVTILKDAASTALYGAKAANGVVVVETRQPEAGSMRVTYTGDFRFDAPDLRGYNLMNAAEKLQFEKLSGRFDNGLNFGYHYQPEYDSLYNVRLAQVRRGVNTYWLAIPLRNGFTNGHSLYAEGGDQQARYGVGISYRNTEGVMKGSGRKTWGANFDLIYRKNRLNISNKLYVNGYNADESPYGSFADFAHANPYFKIRDDSGKVNRLLATAPVTGTFGTMDVPNPLYNALLNSKDYTRDMSIQDNLRMIWTFSDALRLQGAIQLSKDGDKAVTYIPPENTMFDESNMYEKGKYTETHTESFSYQANIMLTYAKLFARRHRLTANLRADIEQTHNDLFSAVATGFPLGSNGDPAFAFSYQPNAKPATADRLYRRNNVLASINYSFDNRYLLDATYRLDGSTAFGSERKYSPFWSVGIGWNLHNEDFLRLGNVNTLRLRGNIGKTGNQNFGSVSSVSVYAYDENTNIFGQGVHVETLGNPGLEWQKTLSTSVGIDFVMMNNRLSATLNAYNNYTDPLVVIVDLPSSTGVYGYATNAGNMTTRGLEADIRFSPVYHRSRNIVWTLGFMGSMVRSKYGGFGNRLESLNKEQLQNSSLIRYRDGYSPDDMWAVRSLGIDPATGKEVFLRSDGQYTFQYNSSDATVVGNTRPKVEGVFSSNLNYKGFLLGLHFRYRFGGDVFNYALYDKVENISARGVLQNQDKRALYDRWQKPGDVARFKSISLTEQTPISSRFVQEENVITGESFNIGYQLDNSLWMRKLGLQSLRVNVYMNDVLRVSSITAERGINYPFARSVSSSISISF